MTATLEQTNETTEAPKRGRAKDRDFTNVNEFYVKYSEYVNMYSDLDEEATPGLVKAVHLLRADFLQSPEWAAQLEQRRVDLAAKRAEKARKSAEKAAREARYANLTDEQVKLAKKAERLEVNAAKAKAEFAAALT